MARGRGALPGVDDRGVSGPDEAVWVEIRFPEGGIDGGSYDPGRIAGATMTAAVDCLPQHAKHKTVGVVDGLVPLGTRVLDVLGLDAAGRQVASVGADLSGVPGAVCRG
jgi:hypothetical protein